MLKRVSKVLVLILAGWLGCASVSLAEEWTVERVSQPAQFTSDGTNWAPLSSGVMVPDRSTVHTGNRGRVMLRRNKETILFGPNSLAAIAKGQNRHGPTTDVVQKVGTLVLNIEKRAQPHTRVQTPFLSAVVKGTTFEVRVGQTGAEVSVSEGLVEVTDVNRGERADVRARQSVSVAANATSALEVRGPGPKSPV